MALHGSGVAADAVDISTVAASSNASYYPLFVASATNGVQVPNLGTGFTFNPSTNTLATTTFSGALSGNATTASAVAVGGITGLGTGVGTALAIAVGSAGAPVVLGGALGTPSSGVGTNITNVNAATLGGATFAAPGAIGGTTPAAGSFTSISATGNLTFAGSGQRILGDFSNATPSTRTLFQTSTTNGTSAVGIIPNGTSVTTQLNLFSNTDPTAAQALGKVTQNTTALSLNSTTANSGTAVAISLQIDGTEKIGISAAGAISLAGATTLSTDRGLLFTNQTSSAAAQVGTLTNAPAAGNPGHWLKISVGGTNYSIPCWAG